MKRKETVELVSQIASNLNFGNGTDGAFSIQSMTARREQSHELAEWTDAHCRACRVGCPGLPQSPTTVISALSNRILVDSEYERRWQLVNPRFTCGNLAINSRWPIASCSRLVSTGAAKIDHTAESWRHAWCHQSDSGQYSRQVS